MKNKTELPEEAKRRLAEFDAAIAEAAIAEAEVFINGIRESMKVLRKHNPALWRRLKRKLQKLQL